MSCSICGDLGHKFEGGVWVRCSCLKEALLKKRIIASGVDVRVVDSKSFQLKSLCKEKSYLEARNWVFSFKQKLLSGVVKESAWFVSSSPLVCDLISLSVVRVTCELDKVGKVYYLRDLLMGITDNKVRQQIYMEAVSLDLVCLYFDNNTIASKGISFLINFLVMLFQRRLREGKCIVVISKAFSDFAKYIGPELNNILNTDFKKIVL